LTQMDSKPPNSLRRWRDVAIMVAVVGAISAILLGDFIAAEWHARDAQREIIDLAGKIPNNATREQVAEAFAWGSYDYLKLRTHDTRDQWFFHTPHRIGAGDWILVVTFDRGQVVAVRVGTSDDLSRRPDGAPPDRNLR
jgi:hypothetical protein